MNLGFKGKGLESEIGGDKIVKILSIYPEINPEWLLTGKGEILKKEVDYGSFVSAEEYLETTGYYYPDVTARAGLDDAFCNSEIVKVPVSIPGFGSDINFVNVFGDSMYPIYNSGDIIGIKEIEPIYINYGYAYVVIMNNEDVYLKYIKKGKDNEHWLFSSENDKYEPKEFHISLVRKIYIIKGKITKTTM